MSMASISQANRVRTRPPNQHCAVAYYRVSSEEQGAEGHASIAAQRERVHAWAREHDVTIAKEAADEESAYRPGAVRANFDALVEYACQDPSVSLFLVDDSSRFARRRAVAVTVKERLARHGVQVITVSEPWADPRTAIGVWMEGFKEIKAEAVSLEIRYHVMKCMKQNAAERDPDTGWCYKNGGRAPIGYRNVRVAKGRDRKGKDVVKLLWEVDEQWAPVVRRIALEMWARAGLSFREIRDKLNGEGLVNPAGQPWHISTIREICYRALDGEYSGIYFWNRTARKVKVVGQKWNDPEGWVVTENAHPAIISAGEWQELQTQVADRRGRSNGSPRAKGSRWLLTGLNIAGEPLFTCAVCGSNMVGYGKEGRDAYNCSRYRYRGKAGCSNSLLVPKDYIEREILALIRRRYTDDRVSELVKLANERAAEDAKAMRSAIAGTKRRIAGLERQLKNVRLALRQGTLATLAAEEAETIQREKAAAEAELQGLEGALAAMKPYSPDEVKVLISRFHEVVARATPEELKQYVRYFVRKLVLDPEKNEVLVEFIEDPFASRARLKATRDKSFSEAPGSNLGGVGGGFRPKLLHSVPLPPRRQWRDERGRYVACPNWCLRDQKGRFRAVWRRPPSRSPD